ncbi:hypothetical protein UVI_02050090 [Ustilaginoidea virens]|nr:hypothetical protein UVI_02050090 [Ustilaginoidea virens]
MAANTTVVAQPQPSAGARCPTPGSTDSQGRYSCNPAHQYPTGQTCQVVNGCYFLMNGSGLQAVSAGAASLSAAGALAVAVCGLLLL